ncbi:MAG TPA: PfkB family carbohydrate kinase, partial [Chloroflexota bacterium]
REPGVISGQEWGKINLAPLVARATAIKASERELARLDDESMEALGGTILLLTEGSKGVEIRVGGDTRFIAARPVDSPNTVGAGDIFLASFVYHFLQHESYVDACEKAMRVTEDILAERIDGRG